MAIQNLAPDAVLESTNYTTLNNADIDDDPNLPDATYGTWDGNGNTVCRVSFSTPTMTPKTGAGLQKFVVLIRRNGATTATGWSLQLYESGVIVGSALATGTLNDTAPTVVEGTWNASSLGTASGANVECRLEQTSGGTGGTRSGVEVGAVKWVVDYDPTDLPNYGGVTIVSSRTRRSYLRPPQGPCTFNSGSPQAVGLVAFYPLNGLLKDRNCVSGRYHLANVNGGAAVTGGGPDGGQCLRCTGSKPACLYTSSGNVPPTTNGFTFACWFFTETTFAGSATTFMTVGDDAISSLGWLLEQSGANVRAKINGSGFVNSDAYSGTIPTAYRWYHATGRYPTSRIATAFFNGGSKAVAGSSANAPPAPDKVIVGAVRSTSSSYDMQGNLAHVCIWTRELSDGEVWTLYDPATRWDLYYPLGRRVWSFSTVVATQTATALVASLAVSGVEPSASGTGSAPVAPDVASVSETAVDLTATGTGTGTATPDAASVAVTAVDGTSAGTGTVTATPEAPAVTVSAHDTTATPTTVTVTPEASSVTVSAHDADAAGSGTATTTPEAPSVSVTSVDTVGAGAGTGTATPESPTVALSAIDADTVGSGTGTATPESATVAVTAHDAAASLGSGVGVAEVVSVTVEGIDATGVGSGTATATVTDAASVAVSSIDASGTPSGSVTGTPEAPAVAVGSADATAVGSGTSTAAPVEAVVTVSSADAGAAGVNTATATPEAPAVTVSSHDVSGTPAGATTVTPVEATISVSGVDAGALGTGTGAITATAATVTITSVDAGASGTGSIAFLPESVTVLVSGHEVAVSPTGSAPAIPLVADVTVGSVDLTAVGSGTVTATVTVATVTVTVIDASAEGGLVIPGPYYIDAGLTWQAGAVLSSTISAGAAESQTLTLGSVLAQVGR